MPAAAKSEAEAPPRAAAAPRRADRLSYKDQKDRQELPGLIEKLEGEIASLHAALCDVTLYQKAPAEVEAAKSRLPCAEAELETAFARWADLEDRAARLQG